MPDLIVYTTPTCAPCRVVKSKLDRLGIAHEVVDLTLDDDALAHLRELTKAATGSDTVHTPTLELGGELRMIGMVPVDLQAVIDEVLG